MSPTPRAVSRIIDTVRAYVNGRARLGFAAWVTAAVSVVLVFAWLFAGSGGWESGTPLPLLLDLLIVVALILGWRAVQARRERWLAVRTLSRSMERAAGLPRGAVRESLELEQAVPRGTSEGLAQLAVHRTAAGLTAGASELAGASGRLADRWLKSGLRALALTLPLAVLVFGFAPDRAKMAWAGLLQPVRLLAGEVLPPLEVSPGTVEVPRGSPVQIDVTATGRTEVTLHWRAAGDVPRSRVEAVADDRAAFPFPSVDAEMEYWAEAPDGAVSEVFNIRPADPLLVTDVAVSLRFPAHTGRPDEEYRGAVPALTVPVGTRIEIVGRASRPLMEAGLEEQEGGFQTRLDVSGPSFGGNWTPRRSGTYVWTFLDADGERPGVVPAPLDVSLVADQPPGLRILFPPADTVIPVTRRQPLVIDARDDYGLDRLEVVAFRTEGTDRTVQPLSLGGLPAAMARPLLDLSEWTLVPGDSVLYSVRLIDNSPAGQATESDVRILRVPTVGDLRRDAQQELEDAVERLQELADRARREAGEAQPPGDRRSGDPMSFEDREQAETALDRQREMSSEVEDLAAELERLAEAMNDGGLADQDLQQDLEELQELLDRMNSDDLEQQMDELEESLSEEDARQAMEDLQQMMENQEEFRQMLEDSLERFRRAAVEQDFRATREEAEELARKEQALAEAMKEEDNPELRSAQQRELEADAEDLQERMERLQQSLEELGEQPAQQSAQEAASMTEQARQSMQQASEAQTGEQAGEQAEQAADQLQQAADALEQAQDNMAEELTKQIQAALQQAATGALSLAEQQAELRDQMRGASREEMAEMRADQAAITEGVRNMAANLEEGLRFSPMDAPGVSELIEAAREEADRTATALGRRGSAPSPSVSADRTVHAMNQVAMSAMTASEQISQASQQQQQSGGEQSQEQMDEMAEQQSDLMNQSAQMMPMQLSQEAMAEQMQQMAQGQQAVASDLGEMSDDPGAEQGAGEQLEEMAAEAAAIAELLASGRLDRETLERQQRLFHRLLEAGRSMEREEEEESEERESEAPGEFERGEVAALTDADMGRVRFPLPSAEYLSRLTPGERRLVLQYFERLNRQNPPGGGVIR